MTDPGNSGFGYQPAPVTEDQTKPKAAICGRCGHEGTCVCPVILASSIEMWTGVDYDTAGRLAAELWANTRSHRLGDQLAEYAPLRRSCTFCGSAVRALPDGSLVSTLISSGADPIDEPICPDSPTHRHALP